MFAYLVLWLPWLLLAFQFATAQSPQNQSVDVQPGTYCNPPYVLQNGLCVGLNTSQCGSGSNIIVNIFPPGCASSAQQQPNQVVVACNPVQYQPCPNQPYPPFSPQPCPDQPVQPNAPVAPQPCPNQPVQPNPPVAPQPCPNQPVPANPPIAPQPCPNPPVPPHPPFAPQPSPNQPVQPKPPIQPQPCPNQPILPNPPVAPQPSPNQPVQPNPPIQPQPCPNQPVPTVPPVQPVTPVPIELQPTPYPNEPVTPPATDEPQTTSTTSDPEESLPNPTFALPAAPIRRCPAGTVLSNGTCRLVYCGSGSVYSSGRCVMPRCPQGTVWTGQRCAAPQPIELPPIHIEKTIVFEQPKTVHDLVVNNVQNLVVNASLVIPTREDDYEDDYSEETESPPTAKCCTVVAPRICRCPIESTRWQCFNRRQHLCGDFCSSSKVVLKPSNVSTWTVDDEKVLIMPPNWNSDCLNQGSCIASADAKEKHDCSGCASGQMASCSPYCYNYHCNASNCGIFDQEEFCNLSRFADSVLCRPEENWKR